MLRLLIWLLSQPLFWAVTGVTAGPFFFFLGFRTLQRKRLIMDIPGSSVRAAALGRVEVSGTAVGPYVLTAPMSGSECLYYRVVVGFAGNGFSGICDACFDPARSRYNRSS